MPDVPVTYWDSCLFISYVGADAEAAPEVVARLPSLEYMLEQASHKRLRILTSVVSRVEVAFTAAEKATRILDAEVMAKIEALWVPPSPVEVVEFFPLLAIRAFELVRGSIEKPPVGGNPPKTLRPLDALHLATAAHLKVSEVYTYDKTWDRFASDVGCAIRRPPEPSEPNLF